MPTLIRITHTPTRLFPPRDPLPSIRRLSTEVGVSTTTVALA